MLIPKEGEKQEGTVIRQKRNPDGTLKGTSSSNPILDTRVYKIEFGDGTYSDYSANVLIENLYDHIDDHGQSHNIIKDITNHRVTSAAIPVTQGTYKTSYGVNKRVITTKGWYLQVEWTNGNQSWVPLNELKESDPIKVAEYAKARNIHTAPAFAWWVNHTLKKRDRIIKVVRARVKCNNLKFGIQVPRGASRLVVSRRSLL